MTSSPPASDAGPRPSRLVLFAGEAADVARLREACEKHSIEAIAIPPSMLVARAELETPAAIVVDGDADDAQDAIDALAESNTSRSVAVRVLVVRSPRAIAPPPSDPGAWPSDSDAPKAEPLSDAADASERDSTNDAREATAEPEKGEDDGDGDDDDDARRSEAPSLDIEIAERPIDVDALAVKLSRWLGHSTVPQAGIEKKVEATDEARREEAGEEAGPTSVPTDEHASMPPPEDDPASSREGARGDDRADALRTSSHPAESRPPERESRASLPPVSIRAESDASLLPPPTSEPLTPGPLGAPRMPSLAASSDATSMRAPLSQELASLLRGAEDRIETSAAFDSVPPSPEEELEAVLPEAVLAALDAPLDALTEEEHAPESWVDEHERRETTSSRTRSGGDDRTGAGETDGRTDAPEARGTDGGTPAGAELSDDPRVPLDAGPPLGAPPNRHEFGEPLGSQTRSSVGPTNESAHDPSSGAEVSAQAHSVRSPDTAWAPPPQGAFTQPANQISPFAFEPGQAPGLTEGHPPVREPVHTLPTQAGDHPSFATGPPSPDPGTNPPTPAGPTQPGALRPRSRARAPDTAQPPHAARIRIPLGEGDAPRLLAEQIVARGTGTIEMVSHEGTRTIVIREGDLITCTSDVRGEALVEFLAGRGELPRRRGAELAELMPRSGRHSGAALVARGFLRQDELWPALRAHAEWILKRAISVRTGSFNFVDSLEGRIASEPGVFGASPGAAVLLEAIRRSVDASEAVARLGGSEVRVGEGPQMPLIVECELTDAMRDAVTHALGRSLRELGDAGRDDDLATVLYALALLSILSVTQPLRRHAATTEKSRSRAPESADELDAAVVRERVALRLALVEEGDYFSLLGVAPSATPYEIRRAYLELRRAFEPQRLLSPETRDLEQDAKLIVRVLEEAYDVLKDDVRRERYRAAIGASPR